MEDKFRKFTEDEKIEALKELNVARESAKKEKITNWFRISVFTLITIVVFITLFRIFLGTVEIENPFEYEKNRFYKVTLNDKTVTVWANERNRIPLIPWFLYFNSRSTNAYDGKLEHMSELEEAKKYILKVKSYSCYDEKLEKRIPCKSKENHFKDENQDTTYTLKIEKRKYHSGTEEKDEFWTVDYIYDGPLIEDVTKYIEDGAEYHFMITGTYGKVTADFDFYINYNRGY